MTAADFLKEQGIPKDNSVLIAYVDGMLRNVDLVKLMEDYAEECRGEDAFNRQCEESERD